VFDNIRKQDRAIMQRSLKACVAIIFLQIMVIVHNLDDFNKSFGVIYTCIFIFHIVGGLCNYSFFKTYFLEKNNAWIDVEINNLINYILLIILALASLVEIYYFDYKIMIYSFLAHLLYYLDDKNQGSYSYMKFIYLGYNTHTTRKMKKTSTL